MITWKSIASSLRNFGKLLSLKALINTKSSLIKGFCRFNEPAITKTLFTALYNSLKTVFDNNY